MAFGLDSKVKGLISSKKMVAFLILSTAFTSSAIFLNSRNYIISDGASTISVTSLCKEIRRVLEKAKIKVGENDEVLVNDTSFLTTNINIKRAVPVSVFVDGAEKRIEVKDGSTVEDVLNKLNVPLNADDELSVPKDATVTPYAKIDINRVEYKQSSFTEDIPFSTEHKETDSLLKGKTKLERAGALGQKEVIVKEKYVNGNLENTERLENILKEPVSKIELVGTKKTKATKPRDLNFNSAGNNVAVKESGGGSTVVDEHGVIHKVKNVFKGKVTAYCDGTYGSTGVKVQRLKHMAVDPRKIPYGSKVYIPELNKTLIAADTGGFVRMGRIGDIRLGNKQECDRFGVRNMTLVVLVD
ncbi:MAG: G5 domain-containing protein [Clostridia bacterium]|nr:G5 domain-containing protein [Clostridia bacterium]